MARGRKIREEIRIIAGKRASDKIVSEHLMPCPRERHIFVLDV
jgi:hypothetical protein